MTKTKKKEEKKNQLLKEGKNKGSETNLSNSIYRKVCQDFRF